ncbi:MAG: GAF domain-containing protein [Anaerolineales bacterium]|nr:GAF domain-containing protein [Anaerolineales bacterium]
MELGDGSISQAKIEELIRMADDLRIELASLRSAIRRNGLTFPSQIILKAERISELMEEYRLTIADQELEQNNLQALVQIGQVINSSLDPTTVLNEVVDTIIRLTGAERAFLMLRTPNGNLETVSARNWEQESLNPSEYELSQSIIHEVMEGGQAVVTTNAQTDPRFSDQSSVITYSLRSILCVPLMVKGTLTGVIYADNRAREGLFTDRDRHVLSAFANQAAVAIENAQLYEAVRRHADELEERVESRTAELAEANMHLRRLSRMKDEFVSNVSHELRTPISSMKLYCSLLETPGEKTPEYLASVQRETDRLEHIIESLLRLSSFDQDQVTINLSPVDVNQFTSILVKDRIPLAQSRDLELSFSGYEDLPNAIADRDLITEAISILLTNALNYTPQSGHIVVSTDLRTNDDQTFVGIHVADSGPGIPEDEESQLFQRFFRGKVGRESGYPGTGLGLAIVKEIAFRNRGSVEVSTEGIGGSGTTFTIWLPTT